MSTAIHPPQAASIGTKLKDLQQAALLLIGTVIGCTTGPRGSSELSPTYFLVTVDGQQLPAPAHDLPDGAVVLVATLDFSLEDRPRGSEPGMVSYRREIRLAD